MLMLPSSYNSQKYSNSLVMFYFLLFIVAFPIVTLSMSLFVSFVSKLLSITSDMTWNSGPFILFWEVAERWLSSSYSQLNCNTTDSQLPAPNIQESWHWLPAVAYPLWTLCTFSSNIFKFTSLSNHSYFWSHLDTLHHNVV